MQPIKAGIMSTGPLPQELKKFVLGLGQKPQAAPKMPHRLQLLNAGQPFVSCAQLSGKIKAMMLGTKSPMKTMYPTSLDQHHARITAA